MTYKTKKKLIHFYSTGAVAEDFAAAKKQKLATFRKIIRACFYVQLGVCAICAAIGFISGFSGAVPVAVCTGILVVVAFFAAGGTTAVKILSCVLDFLVSAAGIIACILTQEPAYGVCGGIMLLGLAAACVSLWCWFCKEFLAGYSARLIKREDYTLLRNFADEQPSDAPLIENFTGDEEPPELPQLTSEMRELANRLSDILRENP